MIELARIVTSYRSLTGAGDVSMVRKDFRISLFGIFLVQDFNRTISLIKSID